jgi:hypothetical protein
MLGLLDAAGVAGGGKLLSAARQVDGFLQERVQGLQISLLLGGNNVVEVLVAPEQVAVAAALGDVEHVVAFQAVHYQVDIEVRTEDVLGNLVATGTHTGPDHVDGCRFAAEDPQPGVEASDSPAGFVGMNDVALPQRFQEQVVGGPGQVSQALLGADEGGRSHVQIGVGDEEVTNPNCAPGVGKRGLAAISSGELPTPWR